MDSFVDGLADATYDCKSGFIKTDFPLSILRRCNTSDSRVNLQNRLLYRSQKTLNYTRDYGIVINVNEIDIAGVNDCYS